MSGIYQDVGTGLKSVGKSSIKKIVNEPYEMLKSAGLPASSESSTKSNFDSRVFYEKSEDINPPATDAEREELLKRQSQMLADLEAELAQIRNERQRKEDERKKRIIEQDREKEIEAYAKNQNPDISTKKSRKFISGMKGKLDDFSRKSEIRMPPSG